MSCGNIIEYLLAARLDLDISRLGCQSSGLICHNVCVESILISYVFDLILERKWFNYQPKLKIIVETYNSVNS